MQEVDKKEYMNAMDTVHAPAELVERTRRLATEQTDRGRYPDKRGQKHCGRVIAAMGMMAAAFAVFLCMSNTSFAKYVRTVFTGFWSEEKEVGSYVQKNIFVDEDSHIRLSVEEVLSDEVYVSVLIKYEAKDDKGKEWLRNDGLVWGLATLRDDWLTLDVDEYSPGGCLGTEELPEYRTDNARYFLLCYEASAWSASMKNCKLHYSMPSIADKEIELDTSTNVPVYEYALKADGQKTLSSFYEPKVLRLTKLSMSVYGKGSGLMVDDDLVNAYTEEYLAEQEQEDMRYVSLIRKDGGVVMLDDVGVGTGGLNQKAAELYSCDCLIASRNLCIGGHTRDDNGEEHLSHNVQDIDPEEIAGLSLTNGRGNVTYRFEELKD